MLISLVREPLAHFLLISVGIYALFIVVNGDDAFDDSRRITVSQADVQVLVDQWQGLWQRAPNEAELDGMVTDLVRNQILYREALAMGLNDGDVVIERRLAQKVELLATRLVAPPAPTATQLQTWYDANIERFTTPARYSITQVFFDPDKRQASTTVDATRLLGELEAMAELPADPGAYGDRFMLRNSYSDRTELDLRRLFGSGFVAQIVELEPGRWHGPILSGFGTHLVHVNEVTASMAAPLAEVEAEVVAGWAAEQTELLSKQFLNEVIDRYEVVIEETRVPLLASGAGAATPSATD